MSIYQSIARIPKLESMNNTIFSANNLVSVINTGFIDRLEVCYLKNDNLYVSEDHFIYRSDDMGVTFNCLGHFDKVNPTIIGRLKDKVGRNRFVRAIRRCMGVHNVLVLNSGTIIIIYDHIYRSVDGGKSFHPVFNFNQGYIAPLLHGATIDKDDNIYFGEYNCGERPHEIRIFKGSNNGENWSICFIFERGKIFHVHSITYDCYRNRLWICTGDLNHESYLFYTDDDFSHLHLLGGGDQDWRICSLIITKEYLYWCSDNDISGSNICRWNFKNKQREKIKHIGKPSYYSTMLNDDTLVFSTTYEPNSTYTNDFNPKPSTEIWVSKNGLDWFKIIDLDHKKNKQKI